jgi:hypothetical protein
MPATETVLRAQLRDAFANRAHVYRLMLQVLEERHGSEEAEAILSEVCKRRGVEVADKLFAGTPADPASIGQRFLSVSPDGGDLYPHQVHQDAVSFSIEVYRCPLKEAWTSAGLGADRIAQLCRVAGAFDRGLFEAAGLCFENSTWTEERGGGCCRIRLSAATAAPD